MDFSICFRFSILAGVWFQNFCLTKMRINVGMNKLVICQLLFKIHTKSMEEVNIFWFRRDLRLADNAGLYHALKAGKPVIPLFIFDTSILDKLENPQDARVIFIHQTLETLKEDLKAHGSTLIVKYGEPTAIWQELIASYSVKAVFTNHDYEPYAIARDTKIKTALAAQEINFYTYKDQVIFEKEEVLKADGTPYTVFTPYSKKWKAKIASKITTDKDGKPISFYLKPYPTLKYAANFWQSKSLPIIELEEMGFKPSAIKFPSPSTTRGLIKNYDQTRNFPGIAGTSRLGIHFRFGTISIREKALRAQQLNETFLNELIWRDFYAMVLAHFPHVVKGPFRKKYENIPWRVNEEEFWLWCEGKTGYPIVDAGMRELNTTGYMHNRVRMITASFLTKHLLIDYRLGEAYFAKHLLDFDLASNNGGWQWAAGCGTDAAPYFRIFNPTTQQQKFDKSFEYIQKWIPEYGTPAYPKPIVDHKMARERCLATFKLALAGL